MMDLVEAEDSAMMDLVEAPAASGCIVASIIMCRGAYGCRPVFFFSVCVLYGWAAGGPTAAELAEVPAGA